MHDDWDWDETARWIIRFFIVVGAVLFCLGLALGRASAQEDPRKEWLRLSYSDFCAHVKPPPQVLVEAVQTAVQLDPKTYNSSARWLRNLIEAVKARQCGDA